MLKKTARLVKWGIPYQDDNKLTLKFNLLLVASKTMRVRKL